MLYIPSVHHHPTNLDGKLIKSEISKFGKTQSFHTIEILKVETL